MSLEQAPKRVKTPNLEVEQQSAADQIELDAYNAAKAALSRTNRGLRFNKILPPGQIGNIGTITGVQ